MDISESYSKYTCWIFPIIGLYPILKLNYSTPLLILLFLHIVLKQRPQITTSSVRSVALLTAFLGYFLITLSYSNNFTQGINEWIRLLPLLLIPPFIFFWNFSQIHFWEFFYYFFINLISYRIIFDYLFKFS